MQLDVQFAAVVGELNLGGLGKGIGIGSGDGTGDGSGTGFGLVTLSELDQPPTVVSAPVFVYPDEAVERGLEEFELQFQILIDEEGRTYPIAIIAESLSVVVRRVLELRVASTLHPADEARCAGANGVLVAPQDQALSSR